MKTKLIFFSVAVLLPAMASAEVYVEPRVSYLDLHGTPGIGDVGSATRSELPDFAPGFSVGYEITPRIRTELRYTYLGELTVHKISPHAPIFPADNVLPVVVPYEFHQESHLFSAALAVEVLTRGKWSVTLTPLLHGEYSNIVIDHAAAPTPPAASRRIFREKETELRGGIELSIRYQLSNRSALSAHYSYSMLKAYDAGLLGMGLLFRF